MKPNIASVVFFPLLDTLFASKNNRIIFAKFPQIFRFFTHNLCIFFISADRMIPPSPALSSKGTPSLTASCWRPSRPCSIPGKVLWQGLDPCNDAVPCLCSCANLSLVVGERLVVFSSLKHHPTSPSLSQQNDYSHQQPEPRATNHSPFFK